MIAVLAAVALTTAVAASPAGAIDGIDVSRWQHPNGAAIDWDAVRQSGQRFVFIKATEGPEAGGSPYVNPYFKGDWTDAARAGLLRGAYHYAQPSTAPNAGVLQARDFVATTGTMQGPMDLPPVLDIEETNGLAPAQMVTFVKSWLTEVERLTGRRPIIYTGLSFWNLGLAGSTEFAAYRLWFARWLDAPTPGQLPSGFLTWTFWQRSSTGRVPGIQSAVDLNSYCCAEANLLALTGPSTNPNAGSPFGSLDAAVGGPDGWINLWGWSIDPDRPDPITTHVYIDGKGIDLGPANSTRPDIGAAYGQFGSSHGFAWGTSGFAPGPHQVCAFGINVDYGANTLLGCRTVVVPGGNPIGNVDAINPLPDGAINLWGWSIDPDTAAATDIHAYLDGVGTNLGPANQNRPDIAAAFPAYGPAHGYSATLTNIAPGPHQLCLFAINRGTGTNTLLTCRTVVVT